MMEHVRFHPCFVTETVHSETEKHRSVSCFINQCSTIDVQLMYMYDCQVIPGCCNKSWMNRPLSLGAELAC